MVINASIYYAYYIILRIYTCGLATANQTSRGSSFVSTVDSLKP